MRGRGYARYALPHDVRLRFALNASGYRPSGVAELKSKPPSQLPPPCTLAPTTTAHMIGHCSSLGE